MEVETYLPIATGLRPKYGMSASSSSASGAGPSRGTPQHGVSVPGWLSQIENILSLSFESNVGLNHTGNPAATARENDFLLAALERPSSIMWV